MERPGRPRYTFPVVSTAVGVIVATVTIVLNMGNSGAEDCYRSVVIVAMTLNTVSQKVVVTGETQNPQTYIYYSSK